MKVDFREHKPTFLCNASAIYMTPSKSEVGVLHYTFLLETGEVLCTCKGFIHNEKCWHSDYVSGLSEEAPQLRLVDTGYEEPECKWGCNSWECPHGI